MGLQLTTPGNTEVQVTQSAAYTHVQMVHLRFDFPATGNKVRAQIVWRKGNLDGGGKFVSVEENETFVPELPTRNWLTQKNTENKMNFIKLEEAMYGYLVSNGEITAGTVVVIPE